MCRFFQTPERAQELIDAVVTVLSAIAPLLSNIVIAKLLVDLSNILLHSVQQHVEANGRVVNEIHTKGAR